MSAELNFIDITLPMIEHLTAILKPISDHRWQFRFDWIAQIVKYRFYTDLKLVVVKLQKTNNPTFYKDYIIRRRLDHIKKAVALHFSTQAAISLWILTHEETFSAKRVQVEGVI